MSKLANLYKHPRLGAYAGAAAAGLAAIFLAAAHVPAAAQDGVYTPHTNRH